jgi:hypothetical protein
MRIPVALNEVPKARGVVRGKTKMPAQRRRSFNLYDYVYSVLLNRDIEINRSEKVQVFLK